MHVLFFSHDAHRGGATIYLHRLIDWILKNSKIKATVVLRKNGSMKESFEKLCPTVTINKQELKTLSRSWIKRKLGLASQQKNQSLDEILKTGSIDAAYLNTIAHGDLIPTLKKYNIPIVTHVHELEAAIRDHGQGLEKDVAKESSAIICVSKSATDNLTKQADADIEKIFTIPNFIPTIECQEEARTAQRNTLLQSIGIASDALIVGFCGLGILRKGIDLVAPLATMIPEKISSKEVHYIWIGKQHQEYPADLSEYDLKKSGTDKRVHFIGEKDNARDWMQTFDVHVLTSREESFGLVVLETANLSIPTVCFDNAGGAGEFVQNDAGFTIPYLNLNQMAGAIEEILRDPVLRDRLGRNSYSRLMSKHTPDIIGPQILAVLNNVAKSKINVTAITERDDLN